MTTEIDRDAIALQIKTTLTAHSAQKSMVTDAILDEKNIKVVWKNPNAPHDAKALTFNMCFTNAAAAKDAHGMLETSIRENNVRKYGAADLGRDVPDAKPAISSRAGAARDARTFEAC